MRDEDEAAVCRGKKAMSADIARTVAKRMGQKGRVVQPYRCVVCRQWHVGAPTSHKTIKHFTRRIF